MTCEGGHGTNPVQENTTEKHKISLILSQDDSKKLVPVMVRGCMSAWRMDRVDGRVVKRVSVCDDP